MSRSFPITNPRKWMHAISTDFMPLSSNPYSDLYVQRGDKWHFDQARFGRHKYFQIPRGDSRKYSRYYRELKDEIRRLDAIALLNKYNEESLVNVYGYGRAGHIPGHVIRAANYAKSRRPYSSRTSFFR